ncbi:MAG: ABC transporter permease [Lacunisphaera sp.]
MNSPPSRPTGSSATNFEGQRGSFASHVAGAAADARYALRQWRKEKGFALATLATLALCIGATTAIFSVVYALVLRPLPFSAAHRIMELSNTATRTGLNRSPGSVAQYLALKAGAKSFEGIALWNQVWRSYGEDGSLERMPGAFASAEIFQVLRVRPVLGSFFTAEQDRPGQDDVVVLTESFWESRFARDPSVVGKTIRIDRQNVTVVGVAARALEAFDARVKYIRALSWGPEAEKPFAHYAPAGRLIGRLAPGVAMAEANAEAQVIERRFVATAPAAMRQFIESSGLALQVEAVQTGLINSVGPVLYLLQAGVAFLLLIGCVNVANLLLVRANARQAELSIRVALGAGRGRIARQLLTESFLLTGFGAALGVGLAWAALHVINRFTGELLPQALPVTLDRGVLGFAAGLTLFVGLGIGLIPLLHVLRANLSGVMQASSRSASAGRGVRSLSSLLVIGQVAVALVLLIGAGLLILAFERAVNVDPGLDRRGIVGVNVNLPLADRASDGAGQAIRDRIEAALREIPGVTSTTMTYNVPFVGGAVTTSIALANHPRPPGSPLPRVFVIAATPGYLPTMRLQLVSGRFFEPRDIASMGRFLVVDETFARTYFPNRPAVGGRISFGGPPANEANWPTIIGVVKDVRQNGAEDRTGTPSVYWFLQGHPSAFGLFFRTERPVGDALAVLREKIRTIDPAIGVFDPVTLESAIDHSFDSRRAVMLLLAAFAILALFLAALGIYGVLSYDVARRTREIGIRGAIGASRHQLVIMIVKDGLLRAGIGLGGGLIAAVLLSRYMTRLLFEVRPTDPGVYATVVTLLFVVAALASFLPARRAAKIDPIVALRAE